jgi:hypothetical protein
VRLGFYSWASKSKLRARIMTMIMWRVFGAGALALLLCASMQPQQAAVAQGMKACISSRVNAIVVGIRCALFFEHCE